MSARDELAAVIHDSLYPGAYREDRMTWPQGIFVEADAILAAGYSKPRTITTAEELEKLPYGSAVQTSDESDTVVLKDKGVIFRNQSGAELSATDLWRYGTRPFAVLYEPEVAR